MFFEFLIADVFSNEMYNSICELAENQLKNINETDHEYRSIVTNIKLTNSLFYKIIPVITKSCTEWRQSYLLTNIICQMLKFVDKSNKVCISIVAFYYWIIEICVYLFIQENKINSVTVEVTDFLLYLSSFKHFRSQFGTQPYIIKHFCAVLSAKCVSKTQFFFFFNKPNFFLFRLKLILNLMIQNG